MSKHGTATLGLAGRLSHIGSWRTHAGTDSMLVVQELRVRVTSAATGEMLPEVTIDPRHAYPGTGRPPGPTPCPKNNTGPTKS